MARIETLPLVGRFFRPKTGAAKFGQVVEVGTFDIGRPVDEAHRNAVVAIWAMGMTDLDIVRARIEEQFRNLSAKEIKGMMKEVRRLRKKGTF